MTETINLILTIHLPLYNHSNIYEIIQINIPVDPKALQVISKLAHSFLLSFSAWLFFRLLKILHSIPIKSDQIPPTQPTGQQSEGLSFKSGITILLYTHLDAILADKNYYECPSVKLFKDLGMKGKHYKSPAFRKLLLEKAFEELQGIPLSSGKNISATLEFVKRKKDYKVIIHNTSSQLVTTKDSMVGPRHGQAGGKDYFMEFLVFCEKTGTLLMFLVYLGLKLYKNILIWMS
jgi:hypothetical protein